MTCVYPVNPCGDQKLVQIDIDTVPEGAFRESKFLEQLSFTSSNHHISSESFINCHQLAIVTFSETLISIGSRAFYGCDKVQSLSFPNTLTEFGSGSFDAMFGLSSVSIPKDIKVTKIPSLLFTSTSLSEFHILKQFDQISAPFISSPNLIRITVDEQNLKYQSILENQIIVSGTTLVTSASGNQKSLVIPSSIEVLGDNSLRATYWSSIRFESGSQLNRIGVQCFMHTYSLKSLSFDLESTIPVSLGLNLFFGSGFKNFDLKLPKIESLSSGALSNSVFKTLEFHQKSPLTSIPSSNTVSIEKLILSPRIITIDLNAFGNEIQKILIPGKATNSVLSFLKNQPKLILIETCQLIRPTREWLSPGVKVERICPTLLKNVSQFPTRLISILVLVLVQ